MNTVAHVIEGKQRLANGTGVSRALRRENLIPGIVYGGKNDPVMVAVDEKQLVKELHTSGFFSRIITLKIDEKDQHVLAKDIQLHPVTDKPLHVDFQRVDKNSRIHVHVPLKFINEEKSPALKRGATLNVVLHNLEIICAPDAIPEEFVVDLSSLEMGGSITLDNIKLPDVVRVANSTRDHVIATLVGGSKDTASE